VLHELSFALHADEMVLLDRGRVQHQGPCSDPATHRRLEQVFEQRIAIVPVCGQWVALANDTAPTCAHSAPVPAGTPG